MIQSAKDFSIVGTSINNAPKEPKNRDLCNIFDEFADVLQIEDSRVVASSYPAIDTEKPVFIDNPISLERKFSCFCENSINACIEESDSSVGNLNVKENGTINKSIDGLVNSGLYKDMPFIALENVKGDNLVAFDVDSKNNLINCKEFETNETPYKDTLRNVSDFSALSEGEITKESSFVDRYFPLLLKADNPAISDKNTDINMITSLNEKEVRDPTKDNSNESFNSSFEEDRSDSMNNLKSDKTNDSLFANEKKDSGTNKLNELNQTNNTDISQRIVKDFGKLSLITASLSNEQTSDLPADRVQLKTEKDVVEPVNAIETEKNYVVKPSNERNNVPEYDFERMDNKSNSNNQDKKNLDKDANISTNNLNKDTAVNRPEFQDFVYKVSEQRSLLSNDSANSASKPLPQQMNLINKGRFAFSESVENVVKFIRYGVNTKAVLIVDPPALGRVNIEIVSTDKGIEAVLRVSNEQIRVLVQDQVVQLRQSLAQIGVNLSEFSVDIQHDGNRSRNQSFNNHRLKKSARTGAAEDESKDERIETFRVDLRKGLLHWIA